MITAVVLAGREVEALGITLSVLVAGVADGLVGDAVVVATGADAGTERVTDASGAAFLRVAPGEDPWAAAAPTARRDWLLCLEAGDVPAEGWIRVLDRFLTTGPRDRPWARLERRGGGLLGRIPRLGRPRLQAGDLVRRRDLLEGGGLRGRPLRLAGAVERFRGG